MEELISVIVVSYNSSATIIETLESIKCQTYTNIEIVVADDCSTDNTVLVVYDWISRNALSLKCKVVAAEHNRGVSANVNLGIKNSTGKLIKIIAADDLLKSNAIEVYYRHYLNVNKKEIIQAKLDILGSVPDTYGDYLLKCYKLINSDNQYKNMLKGYFLLSPAIGLIRKDIFSKYGYFDERFPMLEDYPFFLRLSRSGFQFKLIDDVLVSYRISCTSLSNSPSTSIGSRKYRLSSSKFFFYQKGKWLLEERMYGKFFSDFHRNTMLFVKYRQR